MSTETSRSDDRKQHEAKRRYQGLSDLFQVRKDLNIVHKSLYIGVVFLGLVLVWYGVWTAVSNMWLLSEPVGAIVVGMILLLLTGKIKDLI